MKYRRKIDIQVADLEQLLAQNGVPVNESDSLVLLVIQQGESFEFDLDDAEIAVEVESHADGVGKAAERSILPITRPTLNR